MAILILFRKFFLISFILGIACNDIHLMYGKQRSINEILFEALPQEPKNYWARNRNKFNEHCENFIDSQDSIPELKIENNMEIAMFLAKVFHETEYFKFMEEKGDSKTYGKNRYGVSFKGRGCLQLV